MNENEGTELCVVCEKDLSSTQSITHLYHAGRRFSLCCPMCLDLFQRAPDRFARGERPKTILEELLTQLKWRDS